jgi:type IV pilus assembly protein PilA
MKQIQKGFTLIELMIVVAIIGILAAVAIPAYQDYIVKSKLSTVASSLDSTKMALAQYYQNNGSFPVSAANVVSVALSGTNDAGPDVWTSIGFSTYPTLPTNSFQMTYASTDGTPLNTSLTLRLDKIRVLSVDGVDLTFVPTASSTAFTWSVTCASGGAGAAGVASNSVDKQVKQFFGCP